MGRMKSSSAILAAVILFLTIGVAAKDKKNSPD